MAGDLNLEQGSLLGRLTCFFKMGPDLVRYAERIKVLKDLLRDCETDIVKFKEFEIKLLQQTPVNQERLQRNQARLDEAMRSSAELRQEISRHETNFVEKTRCYRAAAERFQAEGHLLPGFTP